MPRFSRRLLLQPLPFRDGGRGYPISEKFPRLRFLDPSLTEFFQVEFWLTYTTAWNKILLPVSCIAWVSRSSPWLWTIIQVPTALYNLQSWHFKTSMKALKKRLDWSLIKILAHHFIPFFHPCSGSGWTVNDDIKLGHYHHWSSSSSSTKGRGCNKKLVWGW